MRAIDAYCQGLDAQDQQESGSALDLGTAGELDAKPTKLKAQQGRKQAQIKRLEDSGETRLARTDHDARALRKGGQQAVGYNVESTVGAKHKLIVHPEATEVLGVDRLIAEADAGFYSEAQLAACAEANIAASVAIPDKYRAASAEGRFGGAQFPYLPQVEVYICPGGQLLRPQGKPVLERGVERIRYTCPASQCQGCPLKAACLPERTPQRQIWRSEHAEVAEARRQRMAAEGRERMIQRASLVEYPFGTLKRRFGWDHFLVRGFEKFRGEMALMVLGYNLTRAIGILGLQAFGDYCAQRLTGGRMAAQAAVAA